MLIAAQFKQEQYTPKCHIEVSKICLPQVYLMLLTFLSSFFEIL